MLKLILCQNQCTCLHFKENILKTDIFFFQISEPVFVLIDESLCGEFLNKLHLMSFHILSLSLGDDHFYKTPEDVFHINIFC